MRIQVRLGGTVVAPCDGLIVYAGEFRTYGLLVHLGLRCMEYPMPEVLASCANEPTL